MRLINIRTTNFKSLKDLNSRFHPGINLLIGRNNSGKSNLIQSLLVIREFIETSKLPSFKDIAFGKNESLEIHFELILCLDEEEKTKFISELSSSSPEKKAFLDKEMANKIKYMLGLGKNGLINEKVFIFINDNETIYANNNAGACELADHFFDNISPEGVILRSRGGSSPARSIIDQARGNLETPAARLIYPMKSFFSHIYYLNANRFSEEIQNISGSYKLKDDASNLPQVLGSIKASEDEVFAKIKKDLQSLLDDVVNIKLRFEEGSGVAHVCIEENSFSHIEYTWNNISSGMKEIIYQIVLLNITQKGSMLLIEEPEIHLHAEAIKRFAEIMKRTISEDNKQIIITTHSPILMDYSYVDSIQYLTKEEGQTKLYSLSDDEIDQILIKEGLSFGDIFVSKYPRILILVEGSDDYKIFKEFLKKSGIDVEKEKIRILNLGGYSEAIKFGKFIKNARIGIPFLTILDSDTGNEKEDKLQKIRDARFKPHEYIILEKKELEGYLLDTNAISSMLKLKPEVVREAIEKANGNGKKPLEDVLERLGPGNDSDVKALIVSHLDSIPTEIEQIIRVIKDACKIA